MYCKNCGTKIEDGVKFCPNCGTSTQEEAAPAPMATESAAATGNVEEKPPKVWTIFALISKILGIVCLSTSLIPFLNYFSCIGSIPGIVFGCLGKKAQNPEADKNSSLGRKLSIAALVISFVMMVVYIIVFSE